MSQVIALQLLAGLLAFNMKFSQITPVKGRSENVLKNVHNWLKSPLLGELLIIDWACPQRTGKKVYDEVGSDPRVTIIKVPSPKAGPFYDHGLARNIGARRAKFPWLFFLDADCSITEQFNEYFDQDEDLNLRHDLYTFCNNGVSDLPPESIKYIGPKDGQCLIHSSTFYHLNGFPEGQGWGCISYDLYQKAYLSGFQVTSIDPSFIRHRDHEDKDRVFYQRHYWNNKREKESLYNSQLSYLKKLRERSYRSQPGKLFGVPSKDFSFFEINSNYTTKIIPYFEI